jgi:hypothetical protein
MWNEMFLSPEVAYGVLQDVGLVAPLVTKAFPLSPVWTTTRCAVTTEKLTGVAMVCATSADYNKTYLYSLALAAEVDPGGSFSLSDKQAEVAFKMAKLWKKGSVAAGRPEAGRERGREPRDAAGGPGGVQTATLDSDMAGAGEGENTSDEDSEPETGASPLPWEDQGEPLPGDLNQVHKRFQQGLLQVDGRALLEDMPRWAEMKTKAEANNHRGDASRPLDKALKQCQQKVLGLQRIYPVLHHYIPSDGEEGIQAHILGQQFFACLLELERWCLNKRKEASLPNSITPVDPQLFSSEDLRNDQQVQKINRAGYTPGLANPPSKTGFSPSVVFSKPHRLLQAKIQRIWKKGIWNHGTWKRLLQWKRDKLIILQV